MSDHDTPAPKRTKSKPAAILPAAQEPACDECRIRKVRCNKEYPKCSSSRKSNLACGFSNKGKRINHTKKLVNDVEVLGNRLGKIEAALLRCLSVVEGSRTPPNGTTGQTSTQSDDGQVDLSDDSHSDADSRDARSTPSDQYTPVGSGSPASFYHSSPTLSLYTQAQAACDRFKSSFPIQSPLRQYSPVSPELHESQPSNLQSQLKEASELFQKLARESPVLSIPESDGLPPCLPPQGLLQACLEAYFVPLGPSLPIYDRSSVMAAIEEQYSIDSPDPAWIISFSTILLQALDVQSRPSRLDVRGSLRDELISNLLLNCRRGYNNFERLLRPQVANVQALLSMALVALKYFSLATFEAVFAQACQLAKSIGLHQTSGLVDTMERRNLFWSLFIIDKHMSLIAGKPGLLPSYDCGLAPPAANSGRVLDDQLAARISLAYVQEDMYRSLFSARVSRKGRDHITRQAQRIDQKLDDWEVQHERKLSYASDMPADEAVHNSELRYTLCTLRILVQRQISGSDHRHTRLRHARFGLVLLKEVCERRLPASPHLGIAMYQSICVNYSTVLFLELFIGLLVEPQQDHRTDVELLSSFATHMDCCAARSTSTSYPSKNSYMATLCSQIATNIQMLHDGIAPPLSLSMPNSLPDSPGMTTLSSASASAFEPEMMEPSSAMGMPLSTMGDPGWDLSLALGTPVDIHKMDSLHSKVYGQQPFDAHSPYSGFGYSELSGMPPVDFDAMLDAFASYHQGMGVMH